MVCFRSDLHRMPKKIVANIDHYTVNKSIELNNELNKEPLSALGNMQDGFSSNEISVSRTRLS